MNQSFSKIWIIVVFIILIVGGVFAWQYFGIPKEEVKDETADWKTYRNEDNGEYGYEVRYPPDWEIYVKPWELEKIEKPKGLSWIEIKKIGMEDEYSKCIEEIRNEKKKLFCVTYVTSFIIAITPTEYKNIEDFITSGCEEVMGGLGTCPIIKEDIILSGVEGKKSIYCLETASSELLQVLKDGYVYTISMPYPCISTWGPGEEENPELVKYFNSLDRVYDPIHNQILSTFRFLE